MIDSKSKEETLKKLKIIHSEVTDPATKKDIEQKIKMIERNKTVHK